MTSEHGKIDNDLLLSEELIFHGMVTGNVTIDNGGKFILDGMCCKDLIIKEGGECYIHGTVVGNVDNIGGYLEVFGTISGHLRTSNNAETIIGKLAVINNGNDK